MSGTEGIKLEPSWKDRVGDYLLRPEMRALAEFLRSEKAKGKRIFPPGPQIFAALDATPFDAVKVVVLGQDPYHGPGQAHGLCFSVAPGVDVPPSLVNIFKEIERDLGIARPNHGYLMPWAKQGVLLLNAVLTVESGRAGSHQGMQHRHGQFRARVAGGDVRDQGLAAGAAQVGETAGNAIHALKLVHS